MNSPWRDRPIVESLKLFDDMKRGLIDEGKATLRMKQDMQSENKNMYDLIAYRIKVKSRVVSFLIYRLCTGYVKVMQVKHNVFLNVFDSLLHIRMLVTSGAYIQVMIMLIA